MQPEEHSTHKEVPTEEYVMSDTVADMAIGGKTGTEQKNTFKEGQKTAKHSDSRFKIIDLSEYNENRKAHDQTRSSLPFVALLSNVASENLSEDGSKQPSLSISNSIPPRDATINGIHDECYLDDDGVVMIVNDIYKSSGSNLRVGEHRSQPGLRLVGNGADSGVIVDDDEGPCGNCLDTSKTIPTTESAKIDDKSQCHVEMTQESIRQSSGQVGLGVDGTSGSSIEVTVCNECEDHLVMVESCI